MNTDAIHWNPSKPDWHSPCCPTLTNQLKAGSHHPGILKRYRPRLSLTDEPNDAMTPNAPTTTAEVLYP